MNGRLSQDAEIYYPGLKVPHYLKIEMYEKYRSFSEAVVEIKSDGRGGYALFRSTNNSPVKLGKNETVMLQTKLCNGQISLQEEHLEFIYLDWKIPPYVIDKLMKQYHLCSDGKLYIISNEKEELRFLVDTPSYFDSIKNNFDSLKNKFKK